MRVDDIAASWMERLMRPYAGQAANFFGSAPDPFRNPIGQRFRESLHVLTEELLGDMDAERVKAALAAIMEIRAVESRPPSEAVSFIFAFRELAECATDRIDEMALMAFDEYVKCRERIYTAKLNEAKRRLSVMERRAS